MGSLGNAFRPLAVFCVNPHQTSKLYYGLFSEPSTRNIAMPDSDVRAGIVSTGGHPVAPLIIDHQGNQCIRV